ncbi:MAG: cell wall-active antibiotics response protein [Prevotellaceae bacterium]|jgi:predicted membrane protein|nr:cell wall-active antibiotics response protein [Prevotellaceae bacterium]
MKKTKNKGFLQGEYVFGIVLILLGTLFLLFNFGILEKSMKSVIFSWQMLLIVCAILLLLYRRFFSGITVLMFALFFIIPKLVEACPDIFKWLGYDFTYKYWPALLIAVGILIIARLFFTKSTVNSHDKIFSDNSMSKYRSKRKKCNCGCDNCNCNCNFERNAVFGSIEEIILDPIFNGGNISSVFGNIELDLRKTTIPEGDTELEVNSVFGAITLYIPDNWNVELHVSNFAGGFSDDRNINSAIDYSRKLIINGKFVFSGGEIKS